MTESEVAEWTPIERTTESDPAPHVPICTTAEDNRCSPLQNYLLNAGLRQAVFGNPDILKGKFTSADSSSSFFIVAQTVHNLYLEKIPYERIEFPYNDEISLCGTLYGAYDDDQNLLPFTNSAPTTLILSGSFAPHQAFTTGIIEGYRVNGFQVMAFNYIGFGDNADKGLPSAETVYGSSEAALLYLMATRKIPSSKIVIHAYSIAGFPGTKLAASYGTHLVLDRVSSSTADIAFHIMQGNTPNCFPFRMINSCLSMVAHFGVPMTLDDIKKLKGRLFVAQERNSTTEQIGAIVLIEKLINDGALDPSNTTPVWIDGEHITTASRTWTVDGCQLMSKLGFISSANSLSNSIPRGAWSNFLKEIKDSLAPMHSEGTE